MLPDLSFTPDGSRLLADWGAIAIPELPFAGPAAGIEALAALAAPEESGHRFGYGFSPDLHTFRHGSREPLSRLWRASSTMIDI